MNNRSLPRIAAAWALLAPAVALAQTKLNAGPSGARTVGWLMVSLLQLLVLSGFAYSIFKAIAGPPGAGRTRGLAASGAVLVLGIVTIVMAETEPVVMKPFLDRDTTDTIETLGQAEVALAVLGALLSHYAPKLAEAFTTQEGARPENAPPPVEPVRRRVRPPQDS